MSRPLQTLFEKAPAIKARGGEDPKPELVEKPEDAWKLEKATDFEKKVFSVLVRRKSDLGIVKVYRFRNMLIAGALRLENGKVVLLEFKEALNWKNTCNARVQLQGFLLNEKMQEAFRAVEKGKAEGALVIFAKFSGDWDRTSVNSFEKEGWQKFYEEERELSLNRPRFPELPMRIAQITEKDLEYGPLLTHGEQPGSAT